jgi:hypothetical protein
VGYLVGEGFIYDMVDVGKLCLRNTFLLVNFSPIPVKLLLSHLSVPTSRDVFKQ